MYHWYEAHKTYFSTEGERGLIYLKRTNYTQQLPGIETLVTRLQAETGLIKHIDAWPVKFKVTIDSRSFKRTFTKISQSRRRLLLALLPVGYVQMSRPRYCEIFAL